MAPDPWPDEPEEPDPEARWGDPEARWGDPERDLEKRVRIPEVSVPEPTAGSLDPELSRTFWASVLFVNAAVFLLSLGPLLIVFRDQWLLGLGLVAGGALLLGRTYQLYRSYKVRSEDAGDDGDDDDDHHDESVERDGAERDDTDNAPTDGSDVETGSSDPERNP